MTSFIATVTRPSVITGRPVSRDLFIVREWDTYTGIEQGRPVVVSHLVDGPESFEVLSDEEQATIRPAVTAPARSLTIFFASRARGLDPARVVMIPVDPALVADLSVEDIAEEAFAATNAPFEVTGLAAAIRAFFFEAATERSEFYPTLSVGDSVRMDADGVIVRVDALGFTRL